MRTYSLHHIRSAGFTLIELLVVISIVTILSTLITINTSGNDRRQEAAKLVSDIRRAQSLALSGSSIQDKRVCGYGIHFVSPTSYIIYQGRSNGFTLCANTVRNYDPAPMGSDIIVDTKIIVRPTVAMGVFDDIFFEPPDPKTYINNSNVAGKTTQVVMYDPKTGLSCPAGTCATITIATSGRIDLTP